MSKVKMPIPPTHTPWEVGVNISKVGIGTSKVGIRYCAKAEMSTPPPLPLPCVK